MTQDLLNMGQAADADLGAYLFGQFGPALYTGQRGLPSPISPEAMAGLSVTDQQYARYSNYRSQVNLANNQQFQGAPSAATYLLHPDQIEAASNELDRRELTALEGSNQWGEGQVAALIDLARKYPRIAPGVLEGMALGGITDASPDGQYILSLAHEKSYNDDLAAFQGREVTPEKVMSTLGPQEKQYSQNPLIRGLRAATRTGLGIIEGTGQALSAGVQSAFLEAQGEGDAGQRLDELGEAGGGGSLAEILRGAVHEDEDVQLGPGWLPQQGGIEQVDEFGNATTDGSGTEISAGEAAHRRIMQYEGRWLTFGRLIPESINATSRDWFGVNVIEPGAKAYNATSWMADVAFQLSSLNPANLLADAPGAVLAARRGFAGDRFSALAQGLSDVSGVTQARKQVAELAEGQSLRDLLLEDMGQIRATRKTVDSDRAIQWLDSKDGSKFVDYVAGETSLTRLMRVGGLSVKDADLLRGASDSSTVKQILGPLMGRHVTTAPTTNSALGYGAAWAGAGGRVDRMFNAGTLAMKRLTPHFGGGSSGGLLMNPGDLDGVYRQMQSQMRNARFTPDEMEHFNRALAQLPEGDPKALERLIRERFDKTAAKHVEEYTGDQKLAHLATRRYRARAEADRAYWLDQIGNPRRVTGAEQRVLINGEIVHAPSPAMMAEYISSAIPMPDPVEMRRMTAMKGVNKLVNTQAYKNADRVLTKLTSRYWKPAMLLRPAYILRVGLAEQARTAAMGMDSFLNDPVSAIMYAVGRRGDVDLEDGTKLLGDSKQHRAAMNRLSTDTKTGRAGWMTDGKFRAYSLADDETAYMTGWGNEIQMAAEDPVVKHLLEHGRDETIDWFWQGQGRLHREALMTTDAKHTAFNRRGVDPADPDYVDSVEGHIDSLSEIIDNLTGGDTELMEAIRTGKLGDAVIPDRHWSRKERTSIYNTLQGKAAAGVGPQYVRGTRDSEALNLERAGLLDRMLDGVLVHPTNKLSRSPLFKQSFWDNMARMAPDMDDATLDKLQRMAVKANMDKDYLAQIDSIKGKSRQSETVLDDWDAAELLAKDEAVEFTKKMLYDPTIRGNFATLMRNVAPFAEAWKEELQVWGQIVKQGNLKPGVRLAQGWDFLRKSNPFDLDEPSEGPGVFYQNQYGDEVFAVPVGFMVPGATAEAGVANLSMMNFNTFLPGLGPVAQVPASVIINSIPDGQHWLRDSLMDVVLPFGGPDFGSGSVAGTIADNNIPSWLRYTFEALNADVDNPDRNRAFASMVTKTMQARLMSGESVVPQTSAEMEMLIRDSAKDAKALNLVEALLKGSMPSSPNIEFQMKDEAERVWNANVLSDYYYELTDTFGEQGAVTQILKQFGSGGLSALLLSQSQTLTRNAMTDPEFDWKREHRDFYEAHPEAAYHFTTTKKGDFNYDAYHEAINDGSLLRLPVRQQALRMSDRVGALIYRSAQRQAEQIFGTTDSDEARLWLREQNIEIKRSLFGYGSEQGFQKMDPEAELAAVAGALSDAPDNDVTTAIEELIQVHDEANQLAAASGVANYYQSQEAAPIRQGVMAKIENIVGQVPESKTVGDLLVSLMRGASDQPSGVISWGDAGFGALPSATFGASAPASGAGAELFGRFG